MSTEQVPNLCLRSGSFCLASAVGPRLAHSPPRSLQRCCWRGRRTPHGCRCAWSSVWGSLAVRGGPREAPAIVMRGMQRASLADTRCPREPRSALSLARGNFFYPPTAIVAVTCAPPVLNVAAQPTSLPKRDTSESSRSLPLIAQQTGTVDKLAQRGGRLRAAAKPGDIPSVKGSPTNRVGQLRCLVRKLGKHRYRRGLDVSAQAVDGGLPLSGGSFQIPQQR